MYDRFNGVCVLSYVRDPDLPSLMDKLSMFSHGMRANQGLPHVKDYKLYSMNCTRD
jgi:hypothetical protein